MRTRKSSLAWFEIGLATVKVQRTPFLWGLQSYRVFGIDAGIFLSLRRVLCIFYGFMQITIFQGFLYLTVLNGFRFIYAS